MDDYLVACEKLAIPAQIRELKTRLLQHRANPDRAGMSFVPLEKSFSFIAVED